VPVLLQRQTVADHLLRVLAQLGLERVFVNRVDAALAKDNVAAGGEKTGRPDTPQSS
jgi:hypothetical protein